MGATPAMTVSGAAAETTKNAMSAVPRVPARSPPGAGAGGGAVPGDAPEAADLGGGGPFRVRDAWPRAGGDDGPGEELTAFGSGKAAS
ncbi:hypothetical protein ACIRD2_21185 [Streptomyces sp. NPDC093595]|uniref:hypothetical protein n=1 Tax=Streptomyces sp. NPDC093595 TaxID=3366045 RepID=UPI003803FFB9